MNGSDLAGWIQSAIIGGMGAMLWWSIKGWMKGVNEKLTTMSDEIRTLGNKNIGFEKDICRIDRDYENHEKRLHDHSERIRKVEQQQVQSNK